MTMPKLCPDGIEAIRIIRGRAADKPEERAMYLATEMQGAVNHLRGCSICTPVLDALGEMEPATT